MNSSTTPNSEMQSDVRTPVIAFDGAITTVTVPLPNRCFAFSVTFLLNHEKLLSLAKEKPPLHFHPYQEEFITVLEGRLAVEVEGVEHILTSADGELSIKPWTNHRLYPPPHKDGESVTRFLLSGVDTDETYKLDELFFENWYGYQDAVFVHGEAISIIQVMSMFDAGGSYMSLPVWIPFSKTIARAMGVGLGRWVGGFLGYQPYYKKWSTDWGLACRRMKSTFLQRRFAIDDKVD
ncbi:hypothetical protein K458DRAFT_440167 [Lentithecium fluviatile CBS 122367]|uniref:Cupin type-2 domain-containing protein n=1 Tax=Lentithecium fluviatile CBS 122367 TaxID=1168545 RepID=A0A6G1JEA3_9PLEO|nr:hypothetical protein K458DRAFT_440167 [Lentithecium fluviatile CBS 122367]